MHTLNALLIAGLIFRSADSLEGYRFFGQLLTVTVLAMAIHVFLEHVGCSPGSSGLHMTYNHPNPGNAVLETTEDCEC